MNARAAVTDDAVRAQLMTPNAVGEALRQVQDPLTAYRDAVTELHEGRAELMRRRGAMRADVLSVATLVLIVVYLGTAVYVQWYSGASLWQAAQIGAALGVLAAPVGLAAVLRTRSRTNLLNQLAAFWNTLRLPLLLAHRSRTARRWETELHTVGIPTIGHQVIDVLMGEDPHSALLPGSYEGLRSPTGEGWVVDNGAMERLRHKLSVLEGGTVAVSGPRGAGKTTLLQSAARRGDFTVTIRVPAAYTPYDLVLATFVKVCERYLQREGHPLPQLTRLSGFVRVRGRLRGLLAGLGWRMVFGLPAAALVALGMADAVRSQWDRHNGDGRGWAQAVRRWCAERSAEIVQGHDVGAALAVTLAGVWLWSVRTSVPWRSRLLAAPVFLARATGGLLLLVAIVGFGKDPEVNLHAKDLGQGNGMSVAIPCLLFLACIGCLVKASEATGSLVRALWKAGALCAVAAGAALAFHDPDLRGIALDDGNPVRLAYCLAALLLLKPPRLRVRRNEPPLVTQCRDHLYQLRTAQSTSAALNLGIAQAAASLGTSHGSALASVPPNFPQLVDDLRTLLAGIALRVDAEGRRTIVCLDELDRLGSDLQALTFLGEIKAILGVPKVHYLISVAEDVGAAFVRRGLPHRDATDSSLDDVVHVQPCTLGESLAIMGRRASDLTEPYVLLAHALSGGIPRDLIRYGRRILEMLEGQSSEESPAVELFAVSHHLVKEELRDTLSGFRTLLAKEQWTARNAGSLTRYRLLTDYLEHTCPHQADELVDALRLVASDVPPLSGASEPPETARQLMAEAAAYTYFSLTLLQIFQPLGFDDRRKAAAATAEPAADPHALAQARLELAVSPHTARPMIDAVRAAWGLPPLVAPAGSAVIPPPRRACVPCAA